MPRSSSKCKVTRSAKSTSGIERLAKHRWLESGRGQENNSTCHAEDIFMQSRPNLCLPAVKMLAIACPWFARIKEVYCGTLPRLREIIIKCGFHRIGLCQVKKTTDFNLLDLQCQIRPKHFLGLWVQLGEPSSSRWFRLSVLNSAFFFSPHVSTFIRILCKGENNCSAIMHYQQAVFKLLPKMQWLDLSLHASWLLSLSPFHSLSRQ